MNCTGKRRQGKEWNEETSLVLTIIYQMNALRHPKIFKDSSSIAMQLFIDRAVDIKSSEKRHGYC